MPLIMNRALPKHRNWQRPLECLLEESLDLSRLRQRPEAGAAVTDERSGSNQAASRKRTKFGDLFLAFNLDECLRDLCVGSCDLVLHRTRFQSGGGQRAFALFQLAL